MTSTAPEAPTPSLAGGMPFTVGRYMSMVEAKDRRVALDFLLQRGEAASIKNQEAKVGEDAAALGGSSQTRERDSLQVVFEAGFDEISRAHERSQVAAADLEASWSSVETYAKKNAESLVFVKKTFPEQLAKATSDLNYWDNKFLKDVFSLHSAIDAEKLMDDKKKLGLLTVKLKEPGTLGNREFAPLRRCFAPIVRQRGSISKSFTLLINDLEAVQKKSSPLEDRMMESMFDVPLEMPLRHIADYIQKVLLGAMSGHDVESEFYEHVMPQLKSLKKKYEGMVNETNPKVVQATLDSELQVRKDLEPNCMQVIYDAVEAEKSLVATLIPSRNKMEEAYMKDVAIIRQACKGITSSANAVVQQVRDVRAKGIAAMEHEEERHMTGMKEVEYKLKSSHEKQDKLRRQIRELYKALAKEEQNHEHHLSEATERLKSWAQLEAANKQFTVACEAREQLLQTASDRCLYLADLVDESQRLGEEAIKACTLHCSRTLSEESFRKMRASKAAVDNVTEWHRCVGDLECSKQYRLRSVEQKMKDSWQLQYLLDHERKKLEAGIQAIDHERQLQDDAWSEVAVYLADFKVPLPSLSRADQEVSVVKMRSHFVQIEIDQSPDRFRDNSGRGGDGQGGEGQRISTIGDSSPIGSLEAPLVLPPMPPPRRSLQSNMSGEDGDTGLPTPTELPKAPPRGALRRTL